MKIAKDGIRSIVKIGYDGRVHKTFRGTNKEERFINEVRVLQILEARGCDFPNLPDYSFYDFQANVWYTLPDDIHNRHNGVGFYSIELNPLIILNGGEEGDSYSLDYFIDGELANLCVAHFHCRISC